MLTPIIDWYKRNLRDPQAVLLILILVIGLAVVLLLGDMLAPVFAAIVIAYLLESAVQFIKRFRARRIDAVILIFILYLALLFFIVFGLIPQILNQVTQFLTEVPTYIRKGQQALLAFQDTLSFITPKQLNMLAEKINTEIGNLGHRIFAMSLSSIPVLISALIYLVLVPLLVFFFMKDKWIILDWFSNYLPKQRGLAHQVWEEVDMQMGNYIRGKFWEFLALGISCYICFALFEMKYPILFGLIVGLSVIFPYVGFVIVTIPVTIIAYSQFGICPEFYLLMAIYLIINALDGYILVPLLFSEVTNIHPIAIIVSILLFGGLWGFWGVVFAIPLATLVNAILRAWPRAAPETCDVDETTTP